MQFAQASGDRDDAYAQRRRDDDAFLSLAAKAKEALQVLGLSSRTLRNRHWSEIILFFADLVGKVAALPEMFVQKLRGEAQEIAGVVATAILPRVHFLQPEFPFGDLFKPFDSDEDRAAVEAATKDLVTTAKVRVCRPTGTYASTPSST